jgi:hypothetical protein
MPRYDEASAKSSRLEGRRSVKDVAFFQGTAFPGSYKMFEILLKTVPFGSNSPTTGKPSGVGMKGFAETLIPPRFTTCEKSAVGRAQQQHGG